MKVCFSVLSYYPSFITSESINLALLFHDMDNDIRVFEVTTNWARVKNFDDEVDIEYLKLILKGIADETSDNNIFSYKEKFNMKKYINFFVNELKFSDIAFSNTDNFAEFISNTKKMFLRYDYERQERPTHQQQLSYIKNLLKDNEVQFTSKQVVGDYNENIGFDYIIDGYAFKLYTFENRNLNKLIFSAKSWAYTASEVKEKYKTIFVYDIEPDDEYFKAIIGILKQSAFKVMKINEAIDFIFKLKLKNKAENNLLSNFEATCVTRQ